MRQLILPGVILLGLGGFVLLRGASFTSKHDLVKIGDVKVTENEHHAIPPWAGGAAAAAGLVLIFAGMTRKTTR